MLVEWPLWAIMPLETPRGPLTSIHVTDQKMFRDCRTKFRFKVVDRLATISSQVDALYIGVGCHHVLQEHYTAKMAGEPQIDVVQSFEGWVAAKTEEIKSKGGRPERPDEETTWLIHSILKGYVEYYEDAEGDWEILGVEQPISYKVPGTAITLKGTVDLIIKWRGRIWIVDHKFLKNLEANLKQRLELDDQMTSYLWLARNNGINAAGCVYNVIRKAVPREPEILQKGGLSKNKSIDTTPQVYMDAIEKHGLNPNDYTEILDFLATKPNTFFHRELVYRNKFELQAFEADLPHVVRDMTSTETRFYPNPGMNCGWCDFRALCKGAREGADIEYTKQHLYRVRDDLER